MANERIALGINLRKNKNSTSTAFGKYYPEVDVQKTLSLRGFAEHMVMHGSIYGRSIVEGVLLQICDCLPELVAQGVPVQLGSLGTFYPTAEVKEKAAVLNIPAMDGLNPNDIVKAIHIRFLPDSTKLDNLCGPQFKNRCTLELRNIIDTQEVIVNGKTKKMQTLKPIATAVAEWKEANGSSQNENSGTSGSGSTPTLTITKTGSGTSSVRVDGDVVNSGATVQSGKTINIHVEPATGQVPTATLNGQSVTLTDEDGAYDGTATMPAANATLVIDSGTAGGGVDQN
ncbi:MAG: hypothetical protein J5770_01610 [Bacteroidaceae bacterium]|nr:hypothetical protein [Bacteroidaceae bacterium]